MHICLIAPNDGLSDPRALVSRHLLETAGHRVSFVAVGSAENGDGVIRVNPTPRSPLQRLATRRESKTARLARLTELLVDASVGTDADIYMPTDPRSLDAAIGAAKGTGGLVSRTPKMRRAADVDLIDIAPGRPESARPTPGLGVFHTPQDDRIPYRPLPGRHHDKQVVLCYRKSEINPGRYLEEALMRSGAGLRVETQGIDFSTVHEDTDVVMFVEGPYPALEVTGSTPVPTLFWAHHGEHHLHANLRLADRYQADAMLLAHSWHLALWYRSPVHRFPFGVATGLLDPSKPLADRQYDVAMVGVGLRSGDQYGRRQQLVEALEEAIPRSRLGFREQVSAAEMSALYGDTRIVINEGGTRHYPITMRVLEAVGSGAVLLSDRLPGMEALLEPESQYALLTEDVARDVTSLLADEKRMQTMADSALETALGLHTYDHRVDELLEIADRTPKRSITPGGPLSPLAGMIARDAEVQRVAHWDAPELARQLPDREIWDARALQPRRLAPAKMETVAIRADSVVGLEDLLRSARRYVYLEGAAQGLDEFLEAEAPQAVTSRLGSLTKVDYLAPSYRIMDFEMSGE